MLLKRTEEDAYFAASNSEKGFFSYYSQCFDAPRVDHVYAIKGGPGTGKSRFMREISSAAERAGWSCEYIYCSSDPNSLDGIILSKGKSGECIALLDATAPHVYEPGRPGSREDLVNLGLFWDVEKLSSHKEEIAALNKQKEEAYRRAYRYLAGVGECIRTRDALMAPYVKREEIKRLADRLLKRIPTGTEYQASPALIHSLGMRGRVMLDTYLRKAQVIFRIADCRGIGKYLLGEIGRIAMEKRLSVRLSYDPVYPEALDGIFLRDAGVCFLICEEELCQKEHKTLWMRRFTDPIPISAVKDDVRYAERMQKAMLLGAVDALSRVKEIHFSLEEIYATAMDFSQKEAFTKEFCKKLLHLQNE